MRIKTFQSTQEAVGFLVTKYGNFRCYILSNERKPTSRFIQYLTSDDHLKFQGAVAEIPVVIIEDISVIDDVYSQLLSAYLVGDKATLIFINPSLKKEQQ
jgi:hypothetical protein